jgi:hypothetical protein
MQRPTYVLVNGLDWNASRKSAFTRLKTLFTWPLTEFLSFKTSKFGMPPIRKVVFLEMTKLLLADFEVFKRNLENAPKVLEAVQDIMNLTRVDPLTKVNLVD